MSEKRGFSSWFLGKKKGGIQTPAEEPGVERLGSPLAGTVIGIEQVSDKVFADKILGDGVAIIPAGGKVYSPADGTVESLLDSHHAVCILTTGGAELLIHVGRDTVSLNGKHFSAYVKEGDKVKRGQLLLTFEREALLAEGFDLATPVVVSNGDEFTMEKSQGGEVRPGDTIITLTKNT
ncbi:PTS glucose transporter subunit IIA [uncultured Pseudoflavonifractor sp.]|uniref:PTS sugar transporter subunit IIA n=1 Tax=uncultured Pseudoflavonifractor sp. TaxID=1221379 RepID=UPI0025DF93AA|nr:PTS glucose transporter subunit IIA [uncultured Pseudoflavonifractor sp.]